MNSADFFEPIICALYITFNENISFPKNPSLVILV